MINYQQFLKLKDMCTTLIAQKKYWFKPIARLQHIISLFKFNKLGEENI